MFWLTVSSAGSTTFPLVLRVWAADAVWGPTRVVSEEDGLRLLAGSGIPAPRLVAADPTGEQAGLPCTLTTALQGSVVLAPSDLDDWLQKLSRMLVRIHRVPAAGFPPRADRGSAADLDLSWLGDDGLAEEARAACLSAPAEDRACLCHGDYQHFNILWSDDGISGVVDWPNIGRGTRGRDVGHCRANLAVLHSVAAAERFRTLYESEIGSEVDPAVDLRELLVFGPPWCEFIPRQVAGRAPLDVEGMAGRVRDLVVTVLSR